MKRIAFSLAAALAFAGPASASRFGPNPSGIYHYEHKNGVASTYKVEHLENLSTRWVKFKHIQEMAVRENGSRKFYKNDIEGVAMCSQGRLMLVGNDKQTVYWESIEPEGAVKRRISHLDEYVESKQLWRLLNYVCYTWGGGVG